MCWYVGRSTKASKGSETLTTDDEPERRYVPINGSVCVYP